MKKLIFVLLVLSLVIFSGCQVEPVSDDLGGDLSEDLDDFDDLLTLEDELGDDLNLEELDDLEIN